MNAVVHAPSVPLWRCYLLEIKCEFLRMAREPAFVLPTLSFPALFYLLFGVMLSGGGGAAHYLLATYAVFGVACAALFGFGVTVAADRERGFLRLKRALPVPPGALLLAKMAMAMLFAGLVLLILGLLATFVAGVELRPAQWLALLAVSLLGALPFCAIGLYIGSLVGSNAAVAVVNLIFMPMAFLSGLFIPMSMLPAVLAKLAPAWPAYHLGQMALKVVGHDAGGAAWLHVAVLAAVTLAFFALAQRRLAAAD